MSKKLQVFISSTYNDLLIERQAAVAAVLKAGHIPAGMELFTAGDQSQWKTIKTWIEQSDVYMLIFGGRYGSIDAESGLSYTELEFNYAVELNKPLFAVVISEAGLEQKVKDGGTAFMEKVNGVLLQNFRNRVLSNIGTFFNDQKDIRLAVYESLSEIANNRDLVGWVRGDEVVDTKPMFEEMKKLSDENTALRAKLTELQRREQKNDAGNTEYRDLLRVLTAEKIMVPGAHYAEKKDMEMALVDVFAQVKDSFASGIENSAGMSDFAQFVFFKIGSKLATFGLVDYEKVAGVRYRRCVLTPKGKQFLEQQALHTLEAEKNSPSVPATELNKTKLADMQPLQPEGSSSVPAPPKKSAEKVPAPRKERAKKLIATNSAASS